MLHLITKRLEMWIDINIDHYMCIFTSRIFKLVLEITYLNLVSKYFFLQMDYELLS